MMSGLEMIEMAEGMESTGIAELQERREQLCAQAGAALESGNVEKANYFQGEIASWTANWPVWRRDTTRSLSALKRERVWHCEKRIRSMQRTVIPLDTGSIWRKPRKSIGRQTDFIRI